MTTWQGVNYATLVGCLTYIADTFYPIPLRLPRVRPRDVAAPVVLALLFAGSWVIAIAFAAGVVYLTNRVFDLFR